MLVLGEEQLAHRIAARLEPLGGVEAVAGRPVRGIEGRLGRFKVLVAEEPGGCREHSGGFLVLALGCDWVLPAYARPLLSAGLPAVSLGELASWLGIDYPPAGPSERRRMEGLRQAAIIIDTEGAEAALPTSAALRCARELAERHRCRVTVFHRALAVDGEDNELHYQQALHSGVEFFRFRDQPAIELVGDGTALISCPDPLLPGCIRRLSCDLVAVAEECLPSELTRELLRRFGWEGHLGGCRLAENNLHYWLHRSPRAGIYLVTLDSLEQIDFIADEIAAVRAGDMPVGRPLLRVDPDRCGLCLTCQRVCPHGAVELEPLPHPGGRGRHYRTAARIEPAACWGCGLCRNECPALAITAEERPPARLMVLAGAGRLVEADRAEPDPADSPIPRLTIFACVNSGLLALKEMLQGGRAGQAGSAAPDGCRALLRVLPVDCVGQVDTLESWRELAEGADGLLALSCHRGACRHLWGERRLRRRWEKLRADYRAATGREPALLLQPVAAMDGRTAAAAVERIIERIERAGRVVPDDCS